MSDRVTDNERRNRKAWQKMTVPQRETGKSGVQLALIQLSMREDFYRRVSA